MIIEPAQCRASLNFNAPRLNLRYKCVAVYPKKFCKGYETVNKFCRYRTANMGEPKANSQFDNGDRTETSRLGTRSGGTA